jgi:hypothetical protein
VQTSALEPTPAAVDPLAGTRPPAPAMPQGIEFRFLNTGDPKKDFHPRHRHVAKIDPTCLVVDGQDPFLALPIEGNPENVRIRQVGAVAAAELLTCDPATGGRSIHRLATDEEAARAKAELAARARR